MSFNTKPFLCQYLISLLFIYSFIFSTHMSHVEFLGNDQKGSTKPVCSREIGKQEQEGNPKVNKE